MKNLFVVGVLLVSTACVTLEDEQPPKPPAITADLTTEELVDAGIRFGGPTLDDVKKQITAKKDWKKAWQLAESFLRKQALGAKDQELMDAMALVQTKRKTMTPDLAIFLLETERPKAREVGWLLSIRFASKAMGKAITEFETKKLLANEEENLLTLEMARAHRANNLTESYSLMRRGLMMTNETEFAEAMRDFDPNQAAIDFINYLSRANLEDLRQLNQKSVNPAACLVILNHLSKRPLPLTHPRLEVLFNYAVSRNPLLSESANVVIDRHLATQRENLAVTLARMPVWVQVAYIENSKRQENPSANMGLFLSHMKKISSHREVIEEIDATLN